MHEKDVSLSFAANCKIVQKQVHQNSKDKGFWEGPDNCNIPTKLALIHSEISEALEAHRKGNPFSTKLLSMKTGSQANDNLQDSLFAEEMADAVIRIMDLAEHMGIDLGSVILAKAKYNEGREKMHGGKKY